MRALKIAGIVVGGLIGLLVLGAVAILLLVDPNDYRDDIAKLAEQHQTDTHLAEMLGKIASGAPVEGMEALIPALCEGEMQLLTDLVPAGTHVLLADPEKIHARAADLVRTGQEFLEASWMVAADGGRAPIDLGASAYQPLAEVRAAALARGLAWWTLSPFSAGPADARPADTGPVRTDDGEVVDLRTHVSGSGVESLTVAGHPAQTYRGDTGAAVQDIAQRVRSGWRVVLLSEGKGTSARMSEVLTEHDIPARVRDPARHRARVEHGGRHRGLRGTHRVHRREHRDPGRCVERDRGPQRRGEVHVGEGRARARPVGAGPGTAAGATAGPGTSPRRLRAATGLGGQ